MGETRSRSVVITGASRGLGLATATHLHRQGWTVLAAMRTPDTGLSRLKENLGPAHEPSRLIDVRSISRTQTRSSLPPPGSSTRWARPMDSCTTQDLPVPERSKRCRFRVVEQIFATNLFGPIRLTKGLLPGMRTAGRGRVVVVSSHAATSGMGAVSAYGASKSALERWAESLSVEIAPFGLGVSVLVTGTFKTDILELTQSWKDATGPYAPLHAALESMGDKMVRFARSPVRFAPVVERALLEPNPFARHAVGPDAVAMVYGNRLLPTRWLQSLTDPSPSPSTGRITQMFTLRFDMRAPTWAAPIENLYAAAVEMAAWAESRGAVVAVLSEHHATADRHLPSPLILATAMAARTERLPILVAAAVLPFYEPVRLAEDIAVLDIISRGRVAYVLGVGHRREEYDHFGVDFRARGTLADERLGMLLEFVRGNEVTVAGRSTRISPRPTSGGPQLFIGGGSLAAARRAGRFGLGLIAQGATPGLTEAYREACREAGHEPGFVQVPAPGAATAIFVADDVDRAWDEIGRHLLHDAVTAAAYRHGETSVASISTAASVDELRADSSYQVITREEATELVRADTVLPLLPLCGGLPPEIAWGYLERAAEAVVRANQ